jgi:hypothetical protein
MEDRISPNYCVSFFYKIVHGGGEKGGEKKIQTPNTFRETSLGLNRYTSETQKSYVSHD